MMSFEWMFPQFKGNSKPKRGDHSFRDILDANMLKGLLDTDLAFNSD